VWSTRQKLIGTLVVPGGLLAAFLFWMMPASYTSSSCTTSTVNGIETSVCQSVGGSSLFAQILATGILVLLIVGPIATSIYLGRTLVRARRR
jgi:hypothetical protein